MRRAFLALLAVPLLYAVILDRIAIVAGDQVITDRQIDQEIRITDLLNGDPVNLSLAERKKAASRLIDQAVIRRELQNGNYQSAPASQATSFLQQVRIQKFPTEADFRVALQKHGVTEQELRAHIQWQMDVLQFIEERFRPGVLIPDSEIDTYYKQHINEYRGLSPEDARDKVRDLLAEQQVNKDFDDWLSQARGRLGIQYKEADLK